MPSQRPTRVPVTFKDEGESREMSVMRKRRERPKPIAKMLSMKKAVRSLSPNEVELAEKIVELIVEPTILVMLCAGFSS